ncbi:transcription elongation factor SPT5 [Cyclospora cayetanensis]|uniref:Transcription elongation factor SPT5 n=1 Tax=Cyclospora cayetanensis TaxID=88456 RepID=A0A6P6RVP4_9EIME|nr:transcription elongation factor SPT5 [Cyclospora cayetanensis]
MLKRAIFGVLGPTSCHVGSSCRAPSRAVGSLRGPTVRGEKCRQNRSKEPAEYKEHETDGSDGEDGMNPAEDPKVRQALLRRAAALYSSDPRGFLRAMQKHERKTRNAKDEDTDEEEESFQLMDPDTDEDTDKRKQETKARKRLQQHTNHNQEIPEADEEAEEEEDEEFKRGKYHCRLCPQKIFIFEADLEKHLHSKVSQTPQRNEHLFNSKLLQLATLRRAFYGV